MFVDKEYILKSLKLYQAERAPKGWNDAMQRAIEVVEDAPSLTEKANSIGWHLTMRMKTTGNNRVERLRGQVKYLESKIRKYESMIK